MKSYHLRLSLTMLVVLIFCCFACRVSKESVPVCKEIKDYLVVEFKTDSSRVQAGDSIAATLTFINKTNDTVEFYPKAVLLMSRTPEGYHTPRKTLRETLNLNDVAKVLPKGKYSVPQVIKVDPQFFSPGLNTYYVLFAVTPLSGKNERYNKLCGVLISPEVSLDVY